MIWWSWICEFWSWSKSKALIMKQIMEKVKSCGVLWLEGLREACCLHRVVILCLRWVFMFIFHFTNFNLNWIWFFFVFCRSKNLLMRTGQCFLFNGFIFLGRLLLIQFQFTTFTYYFCFYQSISNPIFSWYGLPLRYLLE